MSCGNGLIKPNLPSPLSYRSVACARSCFSHFSRMVMKENPAFPQRRRVCLWFNLRAAPRCSDAAAEGSADNYCVSETLSWMWHSRDFCQSGEQFMRVHAASSSPHTFPSSFCSPRHKFAGASRCVVSCGAITPWAPPALWWIIEWTAKCPCLWHLCLLRQAFDVWDPISIWILLEPRCSAVR